MRELAYRTRDLLGRADVDGIGSVLHESWELKRTLADGISNNGIDAAYAAARQAGALGGKLLGLAVAASCSCMRPSGLSTLYASR